MSNIPTTTFEFEEFSKYFELLYKNMDDYVYVYDMINDVMKISDKAVERFNIKSSTIEFVEGVKSLIYPQDAPRLIEELEQLKSGKKDTHFIKYRWLDKELKPVWVICRGTLCKNKEGDIQYLVGCLDEIGQDQDADNITGLLYFKSIKEHCFQKLREGKGMGILFGVDGFRNINKRMGFNYANDVLKEIANILISITDENQSVVKLYSDQFLFVDFNDKSNQKAKEIFDKVRNLVHEKINESSNSIYYTVSAGTIDENITLFNAEDYLNRLCFSLSKAKKDGKNQLYILTEIDYENGYREEELMSKLRLSVENNFQGFEVYFQPIFSVINEELSAFEALLRYKLDDKMVSPVEFIPLLESSGLILEVGSFVLSESVKFSKRINMNRNRHIKVSLNVSYIQMMNFQKYNSILSEINLKDIHPEDFIFELTESGHLDMNSNVIECLDVFREKGFRIAIDDFGTGYSNFYNIISTNPYEIKIDRKFTINCVHDIKSRHVLSQLINIAHSIGAVVVVEGVETKEELEIIKSLNPDYIQGFYYSKPLPFDEVIEKYFKHVTELNINEITSRTIGLSLKNMTFLTLSVNTNEDSFDVIHQSKRVNVINHTLSYSDLISGLIDDFAYGNFKSVLRERLSLSNFKRTFSLQNTERRKSFFIDTIGHFKNKPIWIRVYVSTVDFDEEGKCNNVVLLFMDITQEKEKSIQDSLTGVYNRTYGEILINSMIKDTQTSNGYFVMLDMDGFKDVNDIFGHSKGDEILREVAHKIQSVFSSRDVVSRYGGDEFVIYSPFSSDESEMVNKIEELRDSLEMDVDFEGISIPISASIGVVEVPLHGNQYVELFPKADDALYKAKQNGRNCIVFYDDDIKADSSLTNEYSLATNDYKNILDSMQKTSIFVISEAEHKILYFNERTKKITKNISLGMKCSELWCGTCDDCPISKIGDKQTFGQKRFNKILNKETFMRATRIMWHNRIPAFIIQTMPNIEEMDE